MAANVGRSLILLLSTGGPVELLDTTGKGPIKCIFLVPNELKNAEHVIVRLGLQWSRAVGSAEPRLKNTDVHYMWSYSTTSMLHITYTNKTMPILQVQQI